MTDPNELIKESVDAVAIITAGFSLLELIPAVAGVFSIFWLTVRLYESVIGKPFSESRFAKWLNRWLERIGGNQD